MTGQDILRIRCELGLNPLQLSQVLGVHPSTIYRWESAGSGPVRVDQMQFQILTALDREIDSRKTAEARRQLADSITNGLIFGGGLFALFQILKTVFSEKG